MKMLLTPERLREQIEADPDGLDCEAGSALIGVLHRLERFVEGEKPQTLYPCKVGGVWRFDAMRKDVAALIAALAEKE